MSVAASVLTAADKQALLGAVDAVRAKVAALPVVEEPVPDPVPPPGPPPLPPPEPPPPGPVPADEHAAVMALVPVESATLFVPVGEVRELGGVLAHGGVRVEGTLRLLDGCELWADTLVTAHGTFEVPAGAAATVVVRVGVPADPLSLGRGVIFHGPTRIDGKLVVRSEDSDRRGHVMVMTDDVRIADLEVIDCGRTDKSRPVTDPPDLGNPRGRYPFHLHKCGFNRAIKVGRVRVVNSPGWGVVNHLSWLEADVVECVNTFGAGLVTETGGELGYVGHLTATNIPGTRETVTDHTRNGRTHDDWGFAGHAAHIQGGGPFQIRGLTADGCAGMAVVHMNLQPVAVPVDRLPDTDYADLKAHFADPANAWKLAGSIYGTPGAISSGDIPYVMANVTVRNPGWERLAHFPWSVQNPSWHPLRSRVVDCSYDGCGVMSGYSNRCEYVRLRVRGDKTPTAAGYTHTGVVSDNHFTDCDIRGCGLGVLAPSDSACRITGGTLANVVDVLVLNKPWPAEGLPREVHIEGVDFAALEPDHAPTATFNGRTVTGRWHVYLLPVFTWADATAWQAAPEGDWWPNLFHWKDTFGPSDVITLDGEYLAFEEFGRDWPLPSMVPASVRLKADGTVKTSGEIYDERGWALWGRVPVAGERRPNVRGLFVKEPVTVLPDPPVPVA